MSKADDWNKVQPPLWYFPNLCNWMEKSDQYIL